MLTLINPHRRHCTNPTNDNWTRSQLVCIMYGLTRWSCIITMLPIKRAHNIRDCMMELASVSIIKINACRIAVNGVSSSINANCVLCVRDRSEIKAAGSPKEISGEEEYLSFDPETFQVT